MFGGEKRKMDQHKSDDGSRAGKGRDSGSKLVIMRLK